MANRRHIAGAVAGVAVLAFATYSFSRPPVPFRFLEGAWFEGESLLSEVFPAGPDRLIAHYRLRGTSEDVEGVAEAELFPRGWETTVDAPGWVISPPGVRDVTVYVSQVGPGVVDVEVASNPSLWDQLRISVGLRKRPNKPESAWRFR